MAISCSDCGIEQRIPELPSGSVAVCLRCGRLLDRAVSRGLTVGLVWSVTLLILLFPANLLPLMRAHLRGESRDVYIISGVPALWGEGWPFLALMFALFAVVFPFVRSGLMTTVLAAVYLNRRPTWLGRIYRYAEALRLWAMPEVFVLAGLIIYVRTATQLDGEVAWGGWNLLAVAALSLITPRILSQQDVWRAILPDRPEPRGEDAINCNTCNLILPLSEEGQPCPRCDRRLHLRKPNALSRTTALVVASYILYFPAYYYPMSYTIRPDGLTEHTIMDGVTQLVEAGFWYLAVILFVASVLIPLLKLVGLTWLLMRVRYPAERGLALRTRVHRLIHGIGRWSHTDPFIIAIMVPLMSFPIANAHAGRAALPFALVVTLTMLASRSFDPRLMWDAAEGRL